MADYNTKYPPPGGLKRSFSQSEDAQSPPLSQSTPQQRTFGSAAQHHGHLHDGAAGNENIGFAGQNLGIPAPERQNYGQPIYPRDATMMPAPPSPQTSFDRQGHPQVNGGQGSYPLNQGPSQSSQSPSSYTPIQQPGSVPRARHSSGGGSEGEGEKSTRLNKACDNCSKRKVKVRSEFLYFREDLPERLYIRFPYTVVVESILSDANFCSVNNSDHVIPVSAWESSAPKPERARGADPQTRLQKLSRPSKPKSRTCTANSKDTHLFPIQPLQTRSPLHL